MYLSGNLTDLAHPAGTSALDSLISKRHNERDWLLGKINVSKPYEYRLRSRIRKKLQIFAKFELPLLSKSGFLDIVP
jgi:hypothetical protein